MHELSLLEPPCMWGACPVLPAPPSPRQPCRGERFQRDEAFAVSVVLRVKCHCGGLCSGCFPAPGYAFLRALRE